jgi:hypothetical protein
MRRLVEDVLTCKPFWVGGYEWLIRYCPNGHAMAGGEHTSVFLELKNAGEAEVAVFFTLSCLQDLGISDRRGAEQTKVRCNKVRYAC